MPQVVLLIDDSKSIHPLVKAHLADEPLIVHSAYEGESGLAIAHTLSPDLILLDVDMPGMNGFDVCRLLKADPETAEIRIVFLTAADSIDEKICGLDLQAVDYITKPFDPAELSARVRAALRTKVLLDLLPRAEGHSDDASTRERAGARQLNARLSIGQLMQARSANPWNRKAPPVAAPVGEQAFSAAGR
jgi:DNA-binding response OmpR family regulator